MISAKDRDALIREIYPTASVVALESMARSFGWTLHTLRTQAARMGLRRDPDAVTACKSFRGYQVAQRAREASEAAPGLKLDRDLDYIRACMAGGGFARAEVVGGKTVWIKPEARW